MYCCRFSRPVEIICITNTACWEALNIGIVFGNLLDIPVMDWPYFTHTAAPSHDPEENRYFSIEGKIRRHYVDFPNHLVQDFLTKILKEIPESHPRNPGKQYEQATDLIEQYNDALDEVGIGFLRLQIVNRSSSRNHPYYGIQIRGLDAEKFHAFLDSLARTQDTTLEQKYHYLFNSKYPILEVESKSETNIESSRTEVQTAVNSTVQPEIDSITERTNELLTNVKEWREELQTYWRRTLWQRFNTFPAVHLYLREMESIITNINGVATRGSIPPCYREMRKLLENLSWSIFDDLLFINADYSTLYTEDRSPDRSPPRCFLGANQQWFEWDRRHDNPDFEEARSQLRDCIYDHCMRSRLKYDEKYGATKGVITVVLREKLSYPLYIALSGIEVEDAETVEPFVTPVEIDLLKSGVRRTLHNVIRSLKDGRQLGELDEEFIDQAVDELLDTQHGYLVPSFPSNNQVIGHLDTLWHQELTNPLINLYGEYSFFIHSYPSSWQIFPHSSILEFKIFDYELARFNDAITTLIERYFTDYHRD